MESIVKDQLMSYLLRNKLITEHQHGFLNRHSTCSQLLECINDWTLALNCHKNVDVIYVDFRKAFDCVVHTKLIAKLESYGITGRLLFWIKDFLSNRIQAVKIGKHISSFSDVLSGVPQGSVLGPILFLLYVNDMVDIFGVDLSVKLYADDVKMYSIIDDIGSSPSLQCGLNKLTEWCTKWQMSINISKCFVLTVGRTCGSSLYSINNEKLPFSNTANDLGVCVDSKLRFSCHYDNIVAKAHQRASLILRCFLCRDPSVLFRAFVTFVRPVLEYCSPVWSPVYKCDIDQIEAVQRRFTKKLNGLKSMSYEQRLKTLNTESLELRRLKSDLILMFKISRGCTAVDNKIINFRTDSQTRGDFKIFKPQCKINARAFSFAARHVNCWNALPNSVRNAPSLSSFKRLLRTCTCVFIPFLHVKSDL